MLQSSNFIIKINRVDTLTLSSVITTSLAVAFALDGYLYLATAVLFIAMMADAFDGILARKYQIERNFGRYLDGFMDVLIYLVAPSIIWYQMGFDGYFSLFLMLMIACGCVRLSVFNDIGNIQESDGLSYLGMPVFWSVFILGFSHILLLLLPQSTAFIALAFTLCVFSFFMVYKKPFFKFKSIAQILAITIGGALFFSGLEFYQQTGIQFVDILAIALYLQIPVVIGGVLHMYVVTHNYFSQWKVPIHTPLFGQNKTWRGVIIVPTLTAFGALCLAPTEWLLGDNAVFKDMSLIWVGLLTGVGYILGEFPNSFIKRRLGIKAGGASDRFPMLFIAFDQLDSAIGVALVYALLGFDWSVCLAYMVTFPFVALLVKQLLFNFKLKANPV